MGKGSQLQETPTRQSPRTTTTVRATEKDSMPQEDKEIMGQTKILTGPVDGKEGNGDMDGTQVEENEGVDGAGVDGNEDLPSLQEGAGEADGGDSAPDPMEDSIVDGGVEEDDGQGGRTEGKTETGGDEDRGHDGDEMQRSTRNLSGNSSQEQEPTEMTRIGSKRKTMTAREQAAAKEAKIRQELASDMWDDTPKTSKKKETVLDQWIIKWLGSGRKHISVEGHRQEDAEGSFWHSTAISYRVSNRLVETSSGSRYRLNGNINKLLAIDQGFSDKFVKRFQKGFPADWKALLLEEARQQSGEKYDESGTETTESKTEPVKRKRSNGSRKQKTSSAKDRQKQKGRGATEIEDKRKNKKQVVAVVKTPSLQAQGKALKKTPVSKKREVVVVTPTYINVEEVKTTLSGRKVIPPLHYWSGQRQRPLPYLDGATELLEGSFDYTPVSANSLRVKGSIDISEREKRKFMRTEGPSRKKSLKKSELRYTESDSNVQESSCETSEMDTDKEKATRAIKKRRGRRPTHVKTDAKEDSEIEQQILSRDTQNLSDNSEQKNVSKTSQRNCKEIITRARLEDTSQRPLSVRQKEQDHRVEKGKTQEDSIGAVNITTAENNPYDIYGAVMGVVEQHRKRISSFRDNLRRSSRKCQISLAPALEATKGNNSFSISDDEDFSSDISLSGSGGRRTKRSGQSVSVTKNQAESVRSKTGLKQNVLAGPKSSRSRRTRNSESSVSSSSVNKDCSRSKRKRKGPSKALEKSLLGSNMLPCVLVDKCAEAAIENEESGCVVDLQQENAAQTQGKARSETPATRTSRRGRKSRQQPKGRTEEEEEEMQSDKWQPDELQRLHQAMKMIAPSASQFWLRVAACVGTRTDWECQQVHQAKLDGTQKAPSRIKSKTSTEDKDNDPPHISKEPVALTAGKGTMRRKRQLKELIQQQNQGSEEDLFDSTPFKKQKVAKKNLMNLNLGEEEEEDEEVVFTKTPGSARMKTPSTRLHTLLAPLSGKKTPHMSLASPGLLHSVEKKHMEQYIHGMQKRRPTGRRVKTTPKSALNGKPKQGRVGSRSIAAMSPSVSEAFQVDPVPDPDSDEEEGAADYYWSDEDQ